MIRILFPLLLLLPQASTAAEDVPVQTLTEQELESFEFSKQEDENPPEIEELSVGQRYILSTQRREIKELIARELGIMSLRGDASDLSTLQSLYDRKVLREDDVREWQSVGVLFGDILVEEYDFEWVSYEDDLGVSKALRWRDTNNFVFPVTVFSKRIQFGQEIDARAIYDKIKTDIEGFIAYEQRRRELGLGSS